MKRKIWKHVLFVLMLISIYYLIFPIKFNKILEQTHENRSIRGAIVTLTRGDSLRLLNMLHSIEYFYPKAIGKYPVIIFYDPHGVDMRNFNQDHIKSCVKLKLIFQSIVLFNLIQNPSETINKINAEPKSYNQRTIGYRLMCLFWSHTVFHHEIIYKTYDYIMRLDDDSYLLETITDDLFEYIDRNHLDYVYRAMSWDIPLSGPEFLLPRYLEIYQNTCRTLCLPFHSHMSIYNNFFLTRVAFWHKKSIETFLGELLSNDTILIYSLGDGNIHAVALTIASDTEHTAPLDFAYAHNIHLYGKRNRNFNLQHNYQNWFEILRENSEKLCTQLIIVEPYQKQLKYISLRS